MEDTEARTAQPAILTTRLYAAEILVKETADQGVWCAVLNTIIAVQPAGEAVRQVPAASHPAESDDKAFIEAAAEPGSES